MLVVNEKGLIREEALGHWLRKTGYYSQTNLSNTIPFSFSQEEFPNHNVRTL